MLSKAKNFFFISVSGSSLRLFADRVWTSESEDAGH